MQAILRGVDTMLGR